MKLRVDENGEILLEEVFSGVGFKTHKGEFLGVCMRDSGFEVNYEGTWYSLQGGEVTPMLKGDGHVLNKACSCDPRVETVEPAGHLVSSDIPGKATSTG